MLNYNIMNPFDHMWSVKLMKNYQNEGWVLNICILHLSPPHKLPKYLYLIFMNYHKCKSCLNCFNKDSSQLKVKSIVLIEEELQWISFKFI